MHTPRMQALTKDHFDGKEPHRGIKPDESVAVCVAIQGSILSGEGGKAVRDLIQPDADGRRATDPGQRGGLGADAGLTMRETAIPTESRMEFHTIEDRLTMTTIVLGGEWLHLGGRRENRGTQESRADQARPRGTQKQQPAKGNS